MPPDVRILGLGHRLASESIANVDLASALGLGPQEIEARTAIRNRFFAREGEGPSDLAKFAAQDAIARAELATTDLGLIVFATATPDVTFPGSGCYLQAKLDAPTIGALDVRAQSAGFLCALELAIAFVTATRTEDVSSTDLLGAPVLVAAGEVMSSGLDMSPRGADLTPRFGDGAAAAVVGIGERGLRVRAVRWCTDGTLVDKLWCEYPASRQFPQRITEVDLAAGRHFPRADLAALAPIVRERMASAIVDVLGEAGWGAGELDLLILDYLEPSVARAVAADLEVDPAKVIVPTEQFGHVGAAGLPIALSMRQDAIQPGARILIAAAGAGVAIGAAALEG